MSEDITQGVADNTKLLKHIKKIVIYLERNTGKKEES
jgi:hypothetical protein